MKIDETVLAARSISSTQSVKQASEATASSKSQNSQQASTFAAAKDSATVSPVAAHLAQASDVRMDKVASVQQAIASGNYQVSAEAVADSLISYMSQR